MMGAHHFRLWAACHSAEQRRHRIESTKAFAIEAALFIAGFAAFIVLGSLLVLLLGIGLGE